MFSISKYLKILFPMRSYITPNPGLLLTEYFAQIIYYICLNHFSTITWLPPLWHYLKGLGVQQDFSVHLLDVSSRRVTESTVKFITVSRETSVSDTSESLVMEWLEIAIESNCPSGPRHEGPFTDKQRGVARKAETPSQENMLSYPLPLLRHNCNSYFKVL